MFSDELAVWNFMAAEFIALYKYVFGLLKFDYSSQHFYFVLVLVFLLVGCLLPTSPCVFLTHNLNVEISLKKNIQFS